MDHAIYFSISPCGKEAPICICIHPRSLAPVLLHHPQSSTTTLLSSALDDGRRAVLVLDRAAAGPAGLEALDDGVGLGVAVGDLAEDDVAAVEPGGDDGGDEELGAVGVGAGVGHGQHEGLLVGELEVLVGELLAVDGLAAGALSSYNVNEMGTLGCGTGKAYVAASKVSALQHELRDHAVELAALVAVALLAGAEGAEVLGGLGDDIVEELEVDAAGAGCHMPMSACYPSLIHWPSSRQRRAASGGGRSVLRLSLLSMEVTLPLASQVASGPVQVQSLWQLVSHCHCHQHCSRRYSQIALDGHVGGSGVKGTTVEVGLDGGSS